MIAAAATRGVRVHGVCGYFAERPRRPGFLLYCSRLRESAIREGIAQLAASIPSARVLTRNVG